MPDFTLRTLRDELERRGRAPAMITLKKWSASGFFDGCHLASAILKVQKRMDEHHRRYAADREGPGDGEPIRDFSELKDTLQAIVAEQARLAAMLEKNFAAVEMLDAIRKHLLVQHDQIQGARQPAHAQFQRSANSEQSEIFMAQQRMAKRLHDLEQRVNDLSGNLDSGR